ncbi:MAG: trigger factor [Myxococcota bacterium]|nr:trigger factor [Myxococcota bacterium]
MQYELQVENLSSIRRLLHFTIDQKVVKGELDSAFRTLKKDARLPGFRQGKVPRNILEARFGRQVRNDVSSRLIDESYRKAVTDLDVAGQPALENRGTITGKSNFSFTIGVDVKPEIEVSDYTGVEVAFKTDPVSEEEIDGEIARLLAGRARIEEVSDDRAVESGDFVLAEVKLVKGEGDDAEELANEAGTLVNTAAERYYPGIESLLIGLKKDESGEGVVTIGDTSIFDHLQGVELNATVKVLNIQAHVVPELSDELAEELKYEGGAAGMKAAVTMKLQSSRDEAARNQARVDLLQKLVDSNDFEVPGGMVDEQLQALVEELRVRRAYGGADPRSIKFSDAEIADLRNRATFAAKASCVLAAVSKQENITADDSDVEARITEIASMRGQAVEAIRGYLEREGAFDVLRDRILEEKTLEWLLENADLKEAVATEEPIEPEEAPAEESSSDEDSSSDSSSDEE